MNDVVQTSKEYPRLLTSTLEWYSESSSADISSMAHELLDRRATAHEPGKQLGCVRCTQLAAETETAMRADGRPDLLPHISGFPMPKCPEHALKASE